MTVVIRMNDQCSAGLQGSGGLEATAVLAACLIGLLFVLMSPIDSFS